MHEKGWFWRTLALLSFLYFHVLQDALNAMNIAGDFRDEIFFRPNFGFSADRSCAIGTL